MSNKCYIGIFQTPSSHPGFCGRKRCLVLEFSKDQMDELVGMTFIKPIVDSGSKRNFLPKKIVKQLQSFEFDWIGTCFIWWTTNVTYVYLSIIRSHEKFAPLKCFRSKFWSHFPSFIGEKAAQRESKIWNALGRLV